MTKRITRKDKVKDKALEDRLFNRLMDHIGPILANTFNEQNAYIMDVMAKTISDAHKIILEHSVEERKEALVEMEKVELSTDGGEAKKEDDDGE